MIEEEIIHKIAEKRTVDIISEQAIEACSNLITAIARKQRIVMGDRTLKDTADYQNALNMIYEEIANVTIATEQLIYLYNCQSDIDAAITEQVERIKS